MGNVQSFERFISHNIRYISHTFNHYDDDIIEAAARGEIVCGEIVKQIREEGKDDLSCKDQKAMDQKEILIRSKVSETVIKLILKEDRCSCLKYVWGKLTKSEKEILTFLMAPDDSGDTNSVFKDTSLETNLSVKKSDRQWKLRLSSNQYRMLSRPRGYFVIINNENFDKELEIKDHPVHRMNTDKDIKRLVSVSRGLGFVPKVRVDLTWNQTLEYLKMTSKDPSLKSHDALVLVIMSHGKRDGFITMDTEQIRFDSVYTHFSSSNCPHLIGKPKLIFFVCCRGVTYDGKEQAHDTSIDTQEFVTEVAPAHEPLCRPREISDLMTMYATASGFVSHRDEKNGTYYVKELAAVLAENAHHKSLVEMLDMVSCRFAKLDFDDCKQTPTYENLAFTKQLFFNPGVFETNPDSDSAQESIMTLSLNDNCSDM